MNKKIKILAFAGSIRKDSFNKMALKYAVKGAEDAGAEVEVLDLRDLNLPLYDGDLEAEGLPESVAFLKKKVKESDGILIATPEYNWSVPGVLKNAIDWVSRKTNEFRGETVAFFGASDGHFGTTRSQIALMPILVDLGMFIYPNKVFIPNAQDVFDKNGKILDEKLEEKLINVGKNLVEFTRKLK